jgi:hypothetical protein
MPFGMKVSKKLHSPILKFRNFAIGFSGKENG